MGCGASKEEERSEHHLVSPKIISPRRGRIQKLDGGEQAEDIINSFNFITNEIDAILCPPGMVPIACLTSDSFCIATSRLIINENDVTNVKLPIIAASISRLGRMVCLGHIAMLFSTYFLSKNTAAFFHNVFIWLTSKQILLSTVFLLKIAPAYESELTKEMKSLGFSVESGDLSKNLASYQMIIMSTDLNPSQEDIQKLRDFSDKGGAICCCYAPNESDETNFPINAFLGEFGLSYMYCSISSATSEPVKVQMPYSFDHVKKKNLPQMVKKLRDFITAERIDVNALDDFVPELRYMLLASRDDQIDLLNEMVELCWSYLSKSDYRNENNELVPNIVQSIIIILIIDINSHLPISSLTVMPDCSIFPGIGKADLKDHKVDITIHDQTIISTGLWLPAGVIATVTVDSDISKDNLMIQIGSHSESIITEPTPWKRWPQVACAYKLTQRTTQVYTQFGGIVYIAASEAEKHKVTFVFHKFSKYPRAIEGKPDMLEKTRNFEIPWSEITCAKCIITLPTSALLSIPDIDKVYRFINSTVKWVAEYIGYQVKRQFRIVFDVQTPEMKTIASYPIVIPIADMNELLFQHKKPSTALFRLLSSLGLVCLPDGHFDVLTEVAISQIVGAQIMSNVFNGFDVETDKDYQVTPLFHELWHIHRRINENAIPEIIRNSLSPVAQHYYDEEDRWTAFTRDLSNITQYNFTPIFERLQRIPLNISKDVEVFPVCPSI